METCLLIHPEELDLCWIEQLCQAGVTTLGLHPVGGKHADVSLRGMLGLFEEPAFQALLRKAEDRGLQITCEMHAMRYLLPEDTLRKHPQWMRVNRAGNRTTESNFCCSNPDALALAAENAARLYRRLPGRPRRVAFWLDDAKDAFCHCEKCACLSPSDQQMIILNAMLAGIRSVRRDAVLAYLAYYETLPAPEQTQPQEGIYLEYAPYLRSMDRPIFDEANAACNRSLPGLLQFFGTKDATVLDYWYDNSWFSNYQKPPRELRVDNAVVRADMAYYRSLGFENISCFACYLGQDYRALYGLPDLSAFRLTPQCGG